MSLVWQAADATDTAGTSVAMTHGLTIPEGALMIASIQEDFGDADLAIDGSGWTAVPNTPANGNGCGQSAWTKTAGASEPAVITISNKAAGNEGRMRLIVVYDDDDGTTVLDDADANVSAGDQASLTSPTLDVEGEWFAIYIFGADTGLPARALSVAPSGTEISTHQGSGVGILSYYKTGSGDGTDNNSVTFNAADGVNCVAVSGHIEAAAGGLSIPIAMHHYKTMAAL